MIYELAARVTHEANRAYCRSIGDQSQVPWDEAPEWQKASAINGVKFAVENPGATPESMHENWMREKLDSGWIFGEVKNPEAKTHHCLVEHSQLPLEQRVKDHLFLGIVRALQKGLS
ncbi:MAG: hypothetical protein KF767_08755 [Bdellovibrionaceae bacterium]|nr:hypothetical protein [Pseudobdellovibrionaceae bacterium]